MRIKQAARRIPVNTVRRQFPEKATLERREHGQQVDRVSQFKDGFLGSALDNLDPKAGAQEQNKELAEAGLKMTWQGGLVAIGGIVAAAVLGPTMLGGAAMVAGIGGLGWSGVGMLTMVAAAKKEQALESTAFLREERRITLEEVMLTNPPKGRLTS